MKQTAEEIIELMRIEMPFHLPERIKPYILEAMKLYANAKLDEAAEGATVKQERRLVKNHVLNNLNPQGIRMEFTVVDKQSILSLKEKI